MNKTTEALKLAEEALDKATLVYEANGTHPIAIQRAEEALAAIREALAEQDKQEPVGYVSQSVIDWLSSNERTNGAYSSINLYKNPCGSSDAPLYAAPVRTKDLTDDEIEWLVVDTLETWNSKDTMKDFARAVITAFKEKNK